MTDPIVAAVDPSGPLVIVARHPNLNASIPKESENIRIVEFQTMASFQNEIETMVHGSHDAVFRIFHRVLGFGKTNPAVIFLIYWELFDESQLSEILRYVQAFESDRFVFTLLVGPETRLVKKADGLVPIKFAETQINVELLRFVAGAFSDQKRTYGFERLSSNLIEKLSVFFLIPVLIGLASGLGEGFITRQVSNDRFVLWVDVLFFYLVVMASLSVFLPFILFVLFVMAIRRQGKRVL
jgi:hypothetical protein